MASVAFPGALRASDADRERMIDALKTEFVLGRLTRDELGLRTAQALEARTYAELAAVIPAGRSEARPPLKPVSAHARKPVKKKVVVAWGAAVTVVPAALWATFLTYYGGFFVLFFLVLLGMALSAAPWPSRHGFTSAPTGVGIRRK